MKPKVLFIILVLVATARPSHAVYEKEFLAHKDYFFDGHDSANQTLVWNNGELLKIDSVSEDKLIQIRTDLESRIETDPKTVPGGEVAIRKMLRAIRYWQGPNLTESLANAWKMEVVIVPRIEFVWKDKTGNKHHYLAEVENLPEWVAAVEREMGYFKELVYVLSWGKIRLEWAVSVSDLPLTQLIQSPSGSHIAHSNGEAVVKSVSPNSDARSALLWIPKPIDGLEPPWVGIAYTSVEKEGKSIVFIHTSEERLFKDHGWAKPEGGGLVHEFWHQIEQWMGVQNGFHGFIPNNHQIDHFPYLKKETASQGLPVAYIQYAEFMGLYPTWKMLGIRVK